MAKKSFLVFIFLLATLFAYLAADLLSIYLKTIWDVLPITFHTSPQEKKEYERNENLEQSYKIIAQRNLFQIQPAKDVQEKETDEEKIAPITDLNLKLIGTIIGKGIMPFAIILDKKTKKQDLYTEGDKIGPAKIIKIYRHKVILLHEGAEEMLIAFDQMDFPLDEPVEVSKESSVEKEPPLTRLGKKIEQNHWVLNREDIYTVINNSSQLFKQISIIPHFEKLNDEQPDGFQVVNIKPKSLFDNMGLRNGDVIRSVNGNPIHNPEKAFEAYQKLHNESQIEVVVNRNNRDVTLQYDIND